MKKVRLFVSFIICFVGGMFTAGFFTDIDLLSSKKNDVYITKEPMLLNNGSLKIELPKNTVLRHVSQYEEISTLTFKLYASDLSEFEKTDLNSEYFISEE